MVLYAESLLLYHFYIENKLMSSECTCIYVKYIARNVKQPGVSTILATSVTTPTHQRACKTSWCPSSLADETDNDAIWMAVESSKLELRWCEWVSKTDVFAFHPFGISLPNFRTIGKCATKLLMIKQCRLFFFGVQNIDCGRRPNFTPNLLRTSGNHGAIT